MGLLLCAQELCLEAAPISNEPQLFIGEDARRLGSTAADLACFPEGHDALADRWLSMAVRLGVFDGLGEDLVRALRCRKSA